MEQELLRIQGTVENIVFRNNSNGYTVLDFDSGGDWITVVGEFGEISDGESLIIEGNYVTHSRFGTQFKAEYYEQKFPDTSVNIEKYLASGAIKGIGAKLAVKIVNVFGDKTLDIIEKEPHRLAEIKGISPKKCKEITQDAKRVFALRILTSFLKKYYVKSSYAMKAYLEFGSDAYNLIQKNPYILCNDSIELDFRKADEIALSLGCTEENKYSRIVAVICSVLKHSAENGHSCMPIELLTHEISYSYENLPQEDFTEIYIQAFEKKELFKYTYNNIDYIYLPKYYKAERYIADRIKSIAKSKKLSCDLLINDEEKKNNIKYNPIQRKAISSAVSGNALILTGGPGTGKTTILKAVISIFEKKGLKVFLTAPTGRAVKRLSELTGHEAKTIHRLLEVNAENKKFFVRNEENPLNCDAVIIDETSMVDVLLFEALLRALRPNCKLILTGDSDQLPSVGAGNLLSDLIDGQALTVIRLEEIFRQAQKSCIIMNAHRIVSGEYPDLTQKNNDFFFFRRSNSESAMNLTVSLVKERLPKAYNYSPFDDIQVIAPSRKGSIGTNEINRVLQNEINPPSPLKAEYSGINGIFRQGDKIMQTVNNYSIEWSKKGEKGKGIFNGDIGRIISINTSSKNAVIDFDSRIAEYTFELLIQIELAYAITVHKSQGCEFEAVIIPVQSGFDMLNHRNLLYTAVTRAKKLLILIGNEQVIQRMVNNVHSTKRYTCLRNMLENN